jgi:PAS domain S-box-containing protein
MSAIRIEIVEDERIQARSMAGELEAMGYSICAVAGTGQAALAKAAETHPDLILMDIRLPGEMDGVAAADLIRRSLDIPIIFVTAFTDAATLERAKITGPLGYVLKPVQSGELRTAIEVALHNHAAARQLRESEERHRTLFETMAQGVVYQEAGGAITAANAAAQRILGLTLDEMQGRTSADPRWRAVREDGSPFPGAEHPSMVALSTGSEIGDVVMGVLNPKIEEYTWINVHARPQFRRGETTPYQVYTTFEDVTQRKRSEDALRQANHLMERTLAALDEVVLICDPATHRIDFCSTAIAGIFGYRPEEVTGRPMDMLHLGAEAAADFRRQREAQNPPNGIARLEYQMRRKDGTVFPSEHTIAPLRDAAGQPSLAVHVIRDITERKEQQRELEGLVSVATSLRRAHTVEEMAPAILGQVMTFLSADASALTLVDPATGDSRVQLGAGAWSHRTGARRPAGQGLTAKVIASRQTFVCQDVVAEFGEAEAPVFGDARALACSPLIAGNETVGSLVLGRISGAAAPAFIKPSEVRLLEGIADMAATAIQRARLHEQTQEQLQRLNALHTIDLAISGSMDLHITLGIVLDEVISQLHVDAAAILSLDTPTRSFHLAAARGVRSAALRNHVVRLGEGLPGRAALERQMVGESVVKEVSGGAARTAALRLEGFVSHYCAPLISKGQVRGVLEVLHRAPVTPGPEWQDLLGSICKQAAIAMENAELLDGLRRSNADLILAYDSTLEGWSTALDRRDKEAAGHSRRVMAMAVEMAERLRMSEQELIYLRRGALLHDIGKLAIPDSLLLKNGPLSEEEWAVMRRHPQDSYDMLYPIVYLRPSLDVVYCHHEWWDGSGYPRGLKGEDIPLAARVFSIANVWDALSTNRPYRAALPRDQALAFMHQLAGVRFDPHLLESFFAMLERDSAGA